MSRNSEYTHRVAVIGYLIQDDKFLLLKRNTQPYVWAPPGGHLKPDEDPIIGLRREMREETNLEVEVIAPVDVWFGRWGSGYLLSLDYLIRQTGGSLRLSPEHQDFAWVSLEQLEKGEIVSLDHEIGFTVKDFRKAQRLYQLLTGFGTVRKDDGEGEL